MMVAEKLREDTDAIRAEGWGWVDAAPDFPYGHTYGLRQLRGDVVALTPEEEVTREALVQELDRLEQTYAGSDDLPDEVDQRLGEIEAALEALDNRPMAFAPDEVARAGAFVSIDSSGFMRIERGFVRPEDELPIEAEPGVADPERVVASNDDDSLAEDANGIAALDPEPEPEEDEGVKPLSDRLVTELTAYRTVALRHALGEQPEVAFLAALHALCLQVFYPYALDSCVELTIRSVGFSGQAPGLADSNAAIALGERHQTWREELPKEAGDLWDALTGFDGDSPARLFAHCIAQGVNACVEPYNRRPRAMAHAERLAQAVDLDMVAAGWVPEVDSYLGRVKKARILLAVGEARGAQSATRIEHLKKGEMADQAELLLAGSGWLPEPLRTPGRAMLEPVAVAVPEVDDADTATVTSEPESGGDLEPIADDEEDEDETIDSDLETEHAIAAE